MPATAPPRRGHPGAASGGATAVSIPCPPAGAPAWGLARRHAQRQCGRTAGLFPPGSVNARGRPCARTGSSHARARYRPVLNASRWTGPSGPARRRSHRRRCGHQTHSSPPSRTPAPRRPHTSRWRCHWPFVLPWCARPAASLPPVSRWLGRAPSAVSIRAAGVPGGPSPGPSPPRTHLPAFARTRSSTPSPPHTG